MKQLRKNILARLKSADVSADPGVLAFTAAHWKSVLPYTDHMTAAKDFFVKVAVGDVPPEIKTALLFGDLHAAERDDNRVRPITVPGFVRKLAMSSLQALHIDEVRSGAGKSQFGVGIRNGVPKAFQAFKSLVKDKRARCSKP